MNCIWEKMKVDQEVDIFHAIKHLRYHRKNIVQDLVSTTQGCLVICVLWPEVTSSMWAGGGGAVNILAAKNKFGQWSYAAGCSVVSQLCHLSRDIGVLSF